jgi:hypothetical protein
MVPLEAESVHFSHPIRQTSDKDIRNGTDQPKNAHFACRLADWPSNAHGIDTPCGTMLSL